MELVIASNNEGKIEEFRRLLSPLGYEVMSQSEAGIELFVDETAFTFEENAELKARAIFDRLGCCVLADDSGICVDSLDGDPGVYSARYGGPFLDDNGRNQILLRNMRDIPEGERRAEFVCVLHFISEFGDDIEAKGVCRGEITFEPRGVNGFGYDPIFLYEGKTFAEHTAEFKNKVSHRAKALEILLEKIKKYNEIAYGEGGFKNDHN